MKEARKYLYYRYKGKTVFTFPKFQRAVENHHSGESKTLPISCLRRIIRHDAKISIYFETTLNLSYKFYKTSDIFRERDYFIEKKHF